MGCVYVHKIQYFLYGLYADEWSKLKFNFTYLCSFIISNDKLIKDRLGGGSGLEAPEFWTNLKETNPEYFV
jgi:hypothetical protein